MTGTTGTLPCRHLSVSIPKPWAEVYGYLSDPANWTHWASGLGQMQHDAARGVCDPPPLKWSKLMYCFWHQGGPHAA